MYDVYGVPAATYTEACLIAGVDTPEQVAAEAMYEAAFYEVFGCHPFDDERRAALREPVTCHCFAADNDIPF